MNFIILFRKKQLVDGKFPSKEDESSAPEKEEDISSKKGKIPRTYKVIKRKKKNLIQTSLPLQDQILKTRSMMIEKALKSWKYGKQSFLGFEMISQSKDTPQKPT
jgi:hypothetical protein